MSHRDLILAIAKKHDRVFPLLPEMGQKLRIQLLYRRTKFWVDYYVLIYTPHWELMKSVGSDGSLSLLFAMKVMISHFVSDAHKAMIALIVKSLPSCCAVFSAIP